MEKSVVAASVEATASDKQTNMVDSVVTSENLEAAVLPAPVSVASAPTPAAITTDAPSSDATHAAEQTIEPTGAEMITPAATDAPPVDLRSRTRSSSTGARHESAQKMDDVALATQQHADSLQANHMAARQETADLNKRLEAMKLKSQKLLERARKRQQKKALASEAAMKEHLKTDEAIALSREKRSQMTRIKNEKIKKTKKHAQPPPPAAPAAAKKKSRPPPRLLGGAAGANVPPPPSPGGGSAFAKKYSVEDLQAMVTSQEFPKGVKSAPGNAPF
jgi:hypothetical protein